MATCGLIHPRIDQVQRMLDFAQQMIHIVQVTEADRGIDLAIRIGINTGPVAAGIVGRRRFIYDLWGATVTLARRIGEQAGEYSIIVTDPVRIHAGETYRFVPFGTFEEDATGSRVDLWAVAAEDAAGTTAPPVAGAEAANP
jgi:class 3 adenylate cyclase